MRAGEGQGIRQIWGGALNVDTMDPVSRDKAYYVWAEKMAERVFRKDGTRIKPHKIHYDWKNYTVFRRWYKKNCPDENYVFTHCLNGTDGKTYTPKTCGFFPRPLNDLIRRHARGWDSREVCLMKCKAWLACYRPRPGFDKERDFLDKELERI